MEKKLIKLALLKFKVGLDNIQITQFYFLIFIQSYKGLDIPPISRGGVDSNFSQIKNKILKLGFILFLKEYNKT